RHRSPESALEPWLPARWRAWPTAPVPRQWGSRRPEQAVWTSESSSVSGLAPPYARFGPTCREVAAAANLRTTTGKSAGLDLPARPEPAPRCIRPWDGVHLFAAWARCGLRAARYRTCHREARRRATGCGPAITMWRYAFR